MKVDPWRKATAVYPTFNIRFPCIIKDMEHSAADGPSPGRPAAFFEDKGELEMAMMDHDRISLAHEDEQTTRSVIAGGSTVAAIAGLAGGVLALLGLLDMRPDLFAAIATICIGAAFLIEGGAIASRVSSLRSKTAIRHKWRSALKPAPLLSWLCRYEGESA